jgi:hypothetical protein
MHRVRNELRCFFFKKKVRCLLKFGFGSFMPLLFMINLYVILLYLINEISVLFFNKKNGIHNRSRDEYDCFVAYLYNDIFNSVIVNIEKL